MIFLMRIPFFLTACAMLLFVVVPFAVPQAIHPGVPALRKTYGGTCTMTGGQCAAISFAVAYQNAPTCTVTWTGTGTLTGILSSKRTAAGLQPTSSVNSDSAVVDWKCQGNPN